MKVELKNGLIIKYGLIVSAVIILVVLPSDLLFSHGVSLCAFRNITAIDCPLCGMTRASYNIIRLDFQSAIIYNPVSLLLPFLLVAEIWKDIRRSRGAIMARNILLIITSAGLTILFIVRLIEALS
ncbi:MAG: DUF2752 domain-containing protein [Bacteroidales bacterium]